MSSWRDTGNGHIQCDYSGRRARMTRTRQIVEDNRMVAFSDAEWAKLVELGKKRGRTPEQCVHDFVASCQPGKTGWAHPETFGEDKG